MIKPGLYWVIKYSNPYEVELTELNGSPYGSVLYCKKFSCVFYYKDVFNTKEEAVDSYNQKLFKEMNRLELAKCAIKEKLIYG